MSRKKDGMLMAKIVAKELEGNKTQEQIAQEVGVTRQTVNSYLRSPEAQAIFGDTEKNTLSFVNDALTMLTQDLAEMKGNPLMAGKRAELLTKVIVGIGARVIGAGAKVSASITKTTELKPEERQARLETLKKLLMEDSNPVEVTSDPQKEPETAKEVTLPGILEKEETRDIL